MWICTLIQLCSEDPYVFYQYFKNGTIIIQSLVTAVEKIISNNTVQSYGNSILPIDLNEA